MRRGAHVADLAQLLASTRCRSISAAEPAQVARSPGPPQPYNGRGPSPANTTGTARSIDLQISNEMIHLTQAAHISTRWCWVRMLPAIFR